MLSADRYLHITADLCPEICLAIADRLWPEEEEASSPPPELLDNKTRPNLDKIEERDPAP